VRVFRPCLLFARNSDVLEASSRRSDSSCNRLKDMSSDSALVLLSSSRYNRAWIPATSVFAGVEARCPERRSKRCPGSVLTKASNTACYQALKLLENLRSFGINRSEQLWYPYRGCAVSSLAPLRIEIRQVIAAVLPRMASHESGFNQGGVSSTTPCNLCKELSKSPT
jgi:hypothetical protein